MLRKFRLRKALFLPVVAALLCIVLSAFTFSAISAMHTDANTQAASHRKHTPTPVKRRPTHTPTVKASPTTTNPSSPTPGTSPTAVATGPTGSQSVKLFVEPDDGEQVITNAINGAQHSVWMEMYLLSDTNVIQSLENAAKRGLDVRVMLEPNPVGGGSPQSTIDALNAAGAKAQDTSPSFSLTHEKGIIIDGSTAYIMTCNMTYSALNGKNREYGIIDTTPQDVQGVSDIFNADWNHTQSQVSDASLVVSPDNSRTALTNFINNAKSSLIIEAEEMYDTSIEQAIASAAKRGVQVQVILPTPQSGSSDSNAPGISTIKGGGAQVKEDPQLIMHAKMMVADGSVAYVGSENFSSNSLDKNRELGVFVTDQAIISRLQQTFQSDWNVSQSQIFYWTVNP